MPKLPPLAVQEAPGASLTDIQYKRMERWAQGKFDADWPGLEPAPARLDQLPERDRPQALDSGGARIVCRRSLLSRESRRAG